MTTPPSLQPHLSHDIDPCLQNFGIACLDETLFEVWKRENTTNHDNQVVFSPETT